MLAAEQYLRYVRGRTHLQLNQEPYDVARAPIRSVLTGSFGSGYPLVGTVCPPDNPLVRVTTTLTEPLLAPIRRVLPDLGGIDLSPMVLLVALRLLRGLLLG